MAEYHFWIYLDSIKYTGRLFLRYVNLFKLLLRTMRWTFWKLFQNSKELNGVKQKCTKNSNFRTSFIIFHHNLMGDPSKTSSFPSKKYRHTKNETYEPTLIYTWISQLLILLFSVFIYIFFFLRGFFLSRPE